MAIDCAIIVCLVGTTWEHPMGVGIWLIGLMWSGLLERVSSGFAQWLSNLKLWIRIVMCLFIGVFFK